MLSFYTTPMEIERPVSRQPAPEHAKRVFEGEIFDVYQWEQEIYDGSKVTFEKIARDDTVVMIPTLPEKKLIFLTDEQPGRAPILTFPAGRMDKEGEAPLETARRELLEETGYESDTWELWKAYQPHTKIDWALYIFIAKNCRKVKDADPGPGERITTTLVTLDEVIALIDDPRFVADNLKEDLIAAKYDPESRARLEKKLFG